MLHWFYLIRSKTKVNLWVFIHFLFFLAIILCSSPAPVSEGASTIHLPVKECHVAEGTNCTMYGWGETKSTAFFYAQAKKKNFSAESILVTLIPYVFIFL